MTVREEKIAALEKELTELKAKAEFYHPAHSRPFCVYGLVTKEIEKVEAEIREERQKLQMTEEFYYNLEAVTDAYNALEEAHVFLDDLCIDGTLSCKYVRQTRKRNAIYEAMRQAMKVLKEIEEENSQRSK